jgi:hypothetical protein
MPTAQQIRTEIDNDPKALGYAALRAQSNGPEALAAKLNQAGASSETLFRSYVPLADVLACVVASEYSSLSTANKTLWQDLVVRSAQLKSGDANMRATIAGIFAAGTTSRTNLVNVASRAASRAEALWGEGTVVLDQQVSLALEL